MKLMSAAAVMAGAFFASEPAFSWQTQDLTYRLKLSVLNPFDTTAYMTSWARYDYYYPLAPVGQPNGYAGTSVSYGIHYPTDGNATISITPAPAFGSPMWLNRLDGLTLYWDGHECRMQEPFQWFGSICLFQPLKHDPYNDLKVYGAQLFTDSEPGTYFVRITEI